MPELETARTHLRMFTLDDLDDLARIVKNPAVMRYLGPAGQPMSRTETEIALRSIIKHWRRHHIGRWAVVHKVDQRLIGYGGLRWFEHEGEEGGKPELVYLLDRPYWGAGLATEIARACLTFGFTERRFDRIVAMTKRENAASRHILEKRLGMRCEGSGEYFGIPVVKYSIFRAEYRPNDSLYIYRRNVRKNRKRNVKPQDHIE